MNRKLIEEWRKMKQNENNIDRIVRVALGIVILVAGLAAGSWLGLIGLIPLVTGLVGFCPLYAIFGFSTCPVKNNA